jgi:hypothetical protein
MLNDGIVLKHCDYVISVDMDDRAAERTRLKKEREEKRRKAEEERLVCMSDGCILNSSKLYQGEKYPCLSHVLYEIKP